MTIQKATAYFKKLFDLMLNVEVTDKEGNSFTLDAGMQKAVDLTGSIKSASKKVMLIGNGGSAAIASHMQNDLCKAAGVKAIVFTEPSLLTALSNDDGYECVFEQPVKLWADKDDMLIAISSSGQSENILRAVQAAVQAGCKIITFSGFQPKNPLHSLGDLNFYASSDDYGSVELVHSALTHIITDYMMVKKQEKDQSS